VFAAWCYPLTEIEPQVDAVLWELYHDHLDAYWEPERRLVENGYRGVPFPFDEIEAPRFEMRFVVRAGGEATSSDPRPEPPPCRPKPHRRRRGKQGHERPMAHGGGRYGPVVPADAAGKNS
jgi:hypothetical protein